MGSGGYSQSSRMMVCKRALAARTAGSEVPGLRGFDDLVRGGVGGIGVVAALVWEAVELLRRWKGENMWERGLSTGEGVGIVMGVVASMVAGVEVEAVGVNQSVGELFVR